MTRIVLVLILVPTAGCAMFSETGVAAKFGAADEASLVYSGAGLRAYLADEDPAVDWGFEAEAFYVGNGVDVIEESLSALLRVHPSDGPVFLRFQAGAAHNPLVKETKLRLGGHRFFVAGASVGVSGDSFLAALTLRHLSNANLEDDNIGLNVGLIELGWHW